MRLLSRIGRLLFPPKCLLCEQILAPMELDICRNCRINAPECPVSGQKLPFVDSWVALWYYEGEVRRSILRFKFHGRRGRAKGFGRLLAMKLLQTYPEGFDILTWVPTGRLRTLRRGYDQVELLARAVGQELGIAPTRLLKKVRNNPPQSGISGRPQRRANVLGAYRAVSPEQLAGKRILLLDDIITTGATAGECARVLLTAGAEEVHCGAVASARRQAKTK